MNKTCFSSPKKPTTTQIVHTVSKLQNDDHRQHDMELLRVWQQKCNTFTTAVKLKHRCVC